MTTRDRSLIAVVVAVALLGLFWFMAIKPKRASLSSTRADVALQQKKLDEATSRVRTGLQNRTDYGSTFATVAKLGQAVPADDSVPSMVYQLDTAAKASGVDFRGVTLKPGAVTGAAAAAPAATPSSSSDSGSSGSSSSSTDSSSTGSSSTDSSTTSASTTPAPATQSATSTLPPGAAVGPAGFPTMPFELTFNGSFFRMSGFLRRLDRFVAAGGKTVRIGGRLLTIEGIALSPGRKGFPQVKATVDATAYLVPASEGAAAGATASGPATGTPTTASTSGTTPATPSATVTP